MLPMSIARDEDGSRLADSETTKDDGEVSKG